jgi:hypothetical protein
MSRAMSLCHGRRHRLTDGFFCDCDDRDGLHADLDDGRATAVTISDTEQTGATAGTIGGTSVTISNTEQTRATAVTVGATAATSVVVVNVTTICEFSNSGRAETASSRSAGSSASAQAWCNAFSSKNRGHRDRIQRHLSGR